MALIPQRQRSERGTFGRSSSGVAAVEFALILPIMLLFLFGGFETVRAISSARRLTFLANAIAEQVTVSTTGKISNADMHFFYNATMVVFPQVLRDATQYGNYWWQDINISVSSIAFTTVPAGCTSGCTYSPNVIWSGSNYRSCLVPPTGVSDQLSPSASTLPLDVFGPGTLIVVDLTYKFHTILTGSFLENYVPGLNNLVLRKSVYLQPRYVPTINYQSGTSSPGSDDIITWCAINQSN